MDSAKHISLTDDERDLFDLLLKASKTLPSQPTPRVVGGWIRDRLLGLESDDIDIMLDNATGEEFAKAVSSLLGTNSPHVVKANPHKSKHVNTAKLDVPVKSGKIFSVDFAIARDEVYDDDSRIPSSISTATPEEDATRRDLTINSLFYNLSTGEVEDFTGRGLKDLRDGLAITPLEPMKTFSDDPLRCFRVVRFAARFDLTIDEAVLNAMLRPEIRDGMFRKVSRERIGIEMSKMIGGRNIVSALRLLKNTGMMDGIIDEALRGSEYEGQMSPFDMAQNSSYHNLSLWDHTVGVVHGVAWREDSELTWAALFHDMGKRFKALQKDSKSCPGKTSYIGHEIDSSKMAKMILEWMVLHPLVDPVCKLVEMHMLPHQLLDAQVTALRRFVRKTREAGVSWWDLIYIATADAMSRDGLMDEDVEGTYKFLERKLEEAEKSIDAASRKPEATVLDGNEVMSVLGCKPGPHMMEIMEFVASLTDEKPDISKEEASSMVKDKFSNAGK